MLTLKVTKGLHAGAELALQASTYLIGSDEFSCDVVLLDKGVLPQHARLTVTEDGQVLLAHLDAAPASSDPAAGHGGVPLSDDEALALGAAEIRVLGIVRAPAAATQAAAEATQAPAVDAVKEPALAAADTSEDTQASAADHAHPLAPRSLVTPARERSTRRRGSFFGGVAVSAALLFAAGGAIAVANTLGADDREERQIAAMVQTLGYLNLEVEKGERGEPVVSGYLPSQTDVDRLKSALQRHRYNATLRISVRATVQQFDTGLSQSHYRVVASGDDVTMLEPKPAPTGPRPAPAVDLRIRSASAGDDAYIETEAGQRFYVGSTLPGGFQLAAVTSDGVVVTKGDRRTVVPIN
jgi:type III secretion system YscD/HrpQ family protein